MFEENEEYFVTTIEESPENRSQTWPMRSFVLAIGRLVLSSFIEHCLAF